MAKENKKLALLAKQETRKAQKALYYSHLSLLQRYCKEEKITKAIKMLKNEEKHKKLQIIDWEWLWLKQKAHLEYKTLAGHKKRVTKCTFSPDQKTFASIGQDGRLMIWDLTGKLKREKIQLSAASHLSGCNFSPDGKKIAVLNARGYLTIWHIKKDKILKKMYHKAKGTHCVFTPDGKKVLCSYMVGSRNKSNLVLWNWKKQKKVWEIKTHQAKFYSGEESHVNRCDISSNGKFIATAGNDYTVKIWLNKDSEKPKLWKTLIEENTVNSCRFSPDNKKIVSASGNFTANKDGTAIVWDIFSGKKLFVLKGHSKIVNSASFSTDGNKIVSAGEGGSVILWDAKTGKRLKTLRGHSHGVYDCEFSKDGKLIASCGKDFSVKLWKTYRQPRPQTISLATPPRFCTFSPDSKQVISTGFYANTFDFWDVKTGKKNEGLRSTILGTRYCAFSPVDKSKLLCVNVLQLSIYDLNTHQETIVWRGSNRKNKVGMGIYSPDATKVIATRGLHAKKFDMWDITTAKAKKIAVFNHKSTIAFFAYATKNIILSASQGSKSSIKIWDENTPTRYLLRIKGTKDQHSDRDIRHFDLIKKEDHFLLIAGHGKNLILYRLENNFRKCTKLKTYSDHIETITLCFFMSKGKRVVSASKDGTIKIWETQAKKNALGIVEDPLLTLDAHKNGVTALAISPDNKTLASGGHDKTLKIWRVK